MSKFRKAKEHELQEVVRVFKKAIEKMRGQNIFQWDERYPNEEVLRNDIAEEEIYVLSEDEVIKACVVLNEFQNEEYRNGEWQYSDGKIAVVHRLCIHPDYQGQGVGTTMMRSSEDYLRDQGYQIIRLDSFPANRAALSLYEKLGFTYAGQVTFDDRGYFKLMEKKI